MNDAEKLAAVRELAERWKQAAAALKFARSGHARELLSILDGEHPSRSWCRVCEIELPDSDSQVCGEYHRGVLDAWRRADVGASRPVSPVTEEPVLLRDASGSPVGYVSGGVVMRGDAAASDEDREWLRGVTEDEPGEARETVVDSPEQRADEELHERFLSPATRVRWGALPESDAPLSPSGQMREALNYKERRAALTLLPAGEAAALTEDERRELDLIVRRLRLAQQEYALARRHAGCESHALEEARRVADAERDLMALRKRVRDRMTTQDGGDR